MASQIGHGLQALHAKGIIHRDLKPQNVLLTRNLTARISDMGLSKRLLGDESFVESGSVGAQASLTAQVRGKLGGISSSDLNMYG